MKYIIFLFFLFITQQATAQPWMPQNVTGPVKLNDVVDNYRRNNPREPKVEIIENKQEFREDKDYLFERWAWYWGRHLDENGYLVSSVKNWEEWRKYNAIHTVDNSKNRTTSIPSNWVFQGPNSSEGGYWGLGRINTMAFHPTDPLTFFVGSAGGGTWKTTDGGNSWAPLYNNLPTVGVSVIAVNPLNANTIYVCTGDADGQDDYSIGVLKTTDGGITWSNTGIHWTSTNYNFARSMLINPLDTNTVIVATSVGLYKSFDGGVTFLHYNSNNYKQILFDPLDTNIIYGTVYAGASAQIMRSADGGVTWTTVTNFTSAQRVNIATTPANPALVMAIASNQKSGLQGIYSSIDEGQTYSPTFINDTSCNKNLLNWEFSMPTTDCGGQGWYDLCIVVDPTDANKVIVGGVNNYYSSDGGFTWHLLTQWYSSVPGIATVHADKHFLAYNPLNNILYENCDGGIYSATNPITGLWNDLTNGIDVTQFYRSSVAEGVDFCIAGAQDNGTKKINAGVASELTGGDGMQCLIDYANPTQIMYSGYPNGGIDKTNDGGLTYNNISNAIPDTIKGEWLTPYIIHPQLDNILLVGYDILFASYDYGNSWAAISPRFSTNYKINNIVMPTVPGTSTIFVALDYGNIHVTDDFGTTWSMLPWCAYSTISRMAVDPRNPNILWVTFTGYVPGEKVFSFNRTTNTWTHHNGTLPNVPVNCIAIDSSTGTKYIGTDIAVYYMDSTMNDWALFDNNLPIVIVNDLNINYTNNELWAATYGRGMWKTTKADHINAVKDIAKEKEKISIAPVPNIGSFIINIPDKNLALKPLTVKLMSANGRIAWEQTGTSDQTGNLKIDATTLASGNYLCVVTGENITYSEKIVINR